MHDLSQIILAVLAIFGAGGAGAQFLGNRRLKRRGAPVEETAVRLDIVKQLETERADRADLERERDEANERAARAGRERDAADRRSEAADRRANAERRTAEIWEAHATAVRESCLAHGTPLQLLPPRPVFQH